VAFRFAGECEVLFTFFFILKNIAVQQPVSGSSPEGELVYKTVTINSNSFAFSFRQVRVYDRLLHSPVLDRSFDKVESIFSSFL
jgi:hypothetical protein